VQVLESCVALKCLAHIWLIIWLGLEEAQYHKLMEDLILDGRD